MASRPSGDCRLRLGIPVKRSVSSGPGITRVTFFTAKGDIAISRPDGRTATLSWPGHPDRMVALHRRETAELLAEELRRLDPDELYAETLAWLDAPGITAGDTGITAAEPEPDAQSADAGHEETQPAAEDGTAQEEASEG